MNWLLMILSFLLGGLVTWLWSVRTVTRVIPASEYDGQLDDRYDGSYDEDDRDTRRAGLAGVAGGTAGAAALGSRDDRIDDDAEYGERTEYVETEYVDSEVEGDRRGFYSEREEVVRDEDDDLAGEAVVVEEVDPADEDTVVREDEEITFDAATADGAHALDAADDRDWAAEVEAREGADLDTEGDAVVVEEVEVVEDRGIDPRDAAVVGGGAATGVAGVAAGQQLETSDPSGLQGTDGVETWDDEADSEVVTDTGYAEYADGDDVVDPATTTGDAYAVDEVVVEEGDDVQPVTGGTAEAHTEAIPVVGDAQYVDADGGAEYVETEYVAEGDAQYGDAEYVAEGDVEEPYGPGSARPAADGSGPEGWAIKGNADSGLFHTEESPGYLNTKAEVWFQDEESAIAAGFRHWDRKQR